MTHDFLKRLETISSWAKENGACASEYSKLIRSKNDSELLAVLTANWLWCWGHNFTIEMLRLFSVDDLKAANVIITESEDSLSVETGYVYAYGNATVRAYGNATVWACDNATVWAYDNATVRACDNATVEACDNATVRACDNATVRACDNATVEAYDNATVEACACATINSYNKSGHVIYQFAVCRYISWSRGSMVVEFKMADGLRLAQEASNAQ